MSLQTTRTLQKTATGSYILTLPKEWVHHAGARPGSPVMIEWDQTGNLAIALGRGLRNEDLGSSTLALEDFPSQKLLDLGIKVLYMQGKDKIAIASKSGKLLPEHKRWVKEAVAGLIGTEIGEDFSDRMGIQAIVDYSKFNMDSLITKLASVCISAINDALKALETKDRILADDALERIKQTGRIYRLMIRLMIFALKNRAVGKELGFRNNYYEEIVVKSLIARDLSRLAYHSRRVIEHTKMLQETPVGRNLEALIIEMAESCSRLVSDAVTSYVNSDMSAAHDIISKMQVVRDSYERALTQILKMKNRAGAVSTLTLLIRDLRAVAGHAVGLAEAAVLMKFLNA